MIPISTSDLMFMFSGCDLTDAEQAHHPDNNLKLLLFLYMKTALTYSLTFMVWQTSVIKLPASICLQK